MAVLSDTEIVVALVAGVAVYAATLVLMGCRSSRAVHVVCLSLGILASLAVAWFATFI